MSKIQFGVRDGELISIYNLNDNEALDKCRCVCPECGYPLLACSMNGKQIRHFRHKSGHKHCHYHVDDFLMNFIFNTISKLDELPELDVDDFDRIIVNSKLLNNKNQLRKTSFYKRSFKVLERNAQKIKVEIEGETYILKFVFKKRNKIEKDDQTIVINLSDILKNGEISEDDFNRLNDLAINMINKATHIKTFEQYNFFEEEIDFEPKRIESTKSDFILTTNLKELNNDTTNINPVKKIDEPNFLNTNIHNSICPKCGTGIITLRTNHKTGQKFYGCSNFYSSTKCNYLVTEYYDEVLKEWFFANREI